MKLVHHGAAGMVTGSCHIFTPSNGNEYMVDFGMFQGLDKIQALNRAKLRFNPRDIKHVFLTHAHLDHCGRLPLLAKKGFTGNVYCTEATRELIEVVLYDSAKIARIDDDVDPIYNDTDVSALLSLIKIIEYEKEFSVDNLKVTYKDTGHLLGSAFIEITDLGNDERIVFSGDLGNVPPLLLQETKKPSSSVFVVMESTYGDKNHPDDDAMWLLQKEINLTEEKRSTLLIPAFSLERTQGILYMIKILKREGRVKANLPVFLDSPMAITATLVYKQYKNLFNEKVQHEFSQGDAFDFPGLRITRKSGARKINQIKGAKVIVAGSGMMSGGRIVGHAAKFLTDPKNRLLIVGYQGEETLGREILEGARSVEIYSKRVQIRSNVTQIRNMSAHADQTMLLSWLDRIEGATDVVLIHGDDDGPRETLARKVRERGMKVYTPTLHDEVNLS